MKVLLINSVCGRQSTGRIVTDIKRELIKQGHECVIAYGEAASIADEDDYHIGSEIDRYIHAGMSRLFDCSGFCSKHATIKLIEWIKNYEPDVINLHNIHGYYINITILFDFLKRFDGKVIWTLHDCWSFTGHTAYCDACGCTKWEKGCFKCPLRMEYPSSLVDNSRHNWYAKKQIFTCVKNMTIITPSEWLAGLVRKSFLGEYRIVVVNNGIDTKKFYPEKSNFRHRYDLENKFVLLGVSSPWNEMKGYSDYLRLANILGDCFGIIMVGLTQRQIRRLPKNIIGIEQTSNISELVEIYSSADLYVNLSYCENYPTVNIESMACGTPVITYETGGSPEIVRKYGGAIAEKGNIEEVADICRSIYNGKMKVHLDFNRKESDCKSAISKYLDMIC